LDKCSMIVLCKGSAEKAPRRRSWDEGSNTRVGRVRRQLGFTKNEWERTQPPCPYVLGII
jgi:hypothetical protein